MATSYISRVPHATESLSSLQSKTHKHNNISSAWEQLQSTL